MRNKLSVAVSFSGLANFLGTMGVIGSLVFVGIELRQTQTIAIAGQIQERAKMETDRILSYTQGNLEAQKFFADSPSNLEELSEDELAMTRLGYAWKGIMLQNNYYQYYPLLLRPLPKRNSAYKKSCSVSISIDLSFGIMNGYISPFNKSEEFII